MSKRLDKIQEVNDVLNHNNPAWKEEIDWLIEQAGKVEQLEKDKANLSKLLINTFVADVELMNEFIPNWKLNVKENIEKLLSTLM